MQRRKETRHPSLAKLVLEMLALQTVRPKDLQYPGDDGLNPGDIELNGDCGEYPEIPPGLRPPLYGLVAP